MQIATRPRRYVDNIGNPVIRIEPRHSRYDLVEIKQRQDSVEARLRTAETDAIESFDFEFANESLRGVTPEDTINRRNNGDLIDVMQTIGFAVMDESVKRW